MVIKVQISQISSVTVSRGQFLLKLMGLDDETRVTGSLKHKKKHVYVNAGISKLYVKTSAMVTGLQEHEDGSPDEFSA